MSAAPYMPLFVDAYLADTTHLSAEESGAYLHLLMAMWRRNGSIPNDDADLCRIARVHPSRWSRVKPRLMSFMTVLESGELTQKRLADEWNYVSGRREANARNGKLGGRPKSINNNDIAKANGSVSDNPNESPHTHTHTHTQKKEGAIAPNARAKKSDPEFEDWYSRYPHKVQRGAAERAFVTARKIASLEDLIRGVHRYISTKPEDRQWQNPATWLNGKGWLDEPAGPAIRNARYPPNRKPNPVDAMEQIFREKGWTDEQEFVPSHNGDAERIPPKLSGPQSPVVDLRPGTDWRARSGH